MEMPDSRDFPSSSISKTKMHYGVETWERLTLELLVSKEIS